MSLRAIPSVKLAVTFILLSIGVPVFGAPGEAEPESKPETVQDLIGIWGGQKDFGPEIQGELSVFRGGSRWTAEIAGQSVDVSSDDGWLSFEIAGDLGAFRGRLDPTTRTIRGQWIQPPVTAMFGQRFSSPVELEPAGDGLWRGDVRPLRDRVHLYFVLAPGQKGRVQAFIRNPEVNFGRFFEFTEVRLSGGRVEFWGNLPRQDQKRMFMAGSYAPQLDVLSVFVETFGGTFDLRRIAPEAVSDFFPRAWTSTPYSYRPPTPRDDGWATSDLKSVGMAVGPIEDLVRKIVATPIAAIDSPYIDAVLIARQGKLVLEEYFHGWWRGATHDTRSASKSITSTLLGAAIQAGMDVSLKTPVYEAMLGDAVPEDLDPRARRMTIEHLMTMTPGWACDDWDDASPGAEDRMQNQSEQPDWYRYTLDLPMSHEPGEHAAYCSASPNLVGGILARRSGTPLTELFDRLLGRPLEMNVVHTNLMPTREAYAGGGLRITGRDFLKIGQLLLDDGRWNGERVLPRGWTEAAIKPRHALGGEQYGYAWWMFDYELDRRKWSAFYAGGNGGNYIIGVPDLDLVVVFLASNYNQRVMHETKYQYVPEFILRSILGVPGAAHGH